MSTEVVLGNAADLDWIDDESIDCIVTSPPYNCGISYDGYTDDLPWEDYHNMVVRPSLHEMYRVLKPDGRLWLNLPPSTPIATNTKVIPYRVPLANNWLEVATAEIDFHYRDTIVWKQNSHDGGTAWGSWLSPSAPNIRGEWETIMSFFKGPEWKRTPPPEHSTYMDIRHDLGGDWTDMCRNVWEMPTAKRTYSAAPFPLELPARCIRLSCFPGSRVLDPFGGGGTTAEAADLLGHHGISVDISPEQTRITRDRLTTLFGGPS